MLGLKPLIYFGIFCPDLKVGAIENSRLLFQMEFPVATTFRSWLNSPPIFGFSPSL